MGKQADVVLCLLALIAVVVGVDVLFFRLQAWVLGAPDGPMSRLPLGATSRHPYTRAEPGTYLLAADVGQENMAGGVDFGRSRSTCG